MTFAIIFGSQYAASTVCEESEDECGNLKREQLWNVRQC